MVGQLAVSRAGHDRDTLYLILKEEGNSVYLADGVLKTYAMPKKKNKKHIQLIHSGLTAMQIEELAGNPADADTKIKRCIRLYNERKDVTVKPPAEPLRKD